MKCVQGVGLVFILGLMVPMITQAIPTPPPSPRYTPRVEDFAGFPGVTPEPLYYVREYPYVTLFIAAAVVGGILYYNRAPFRKKMEQVLRFFKAQEQDSKAL